MKIRRYMGKNTQEAILKVKMDLGSDAVILNTRKVKQKGLFKVFSKPLVEVLAAVDDDYGTSKEKVRKEDVKPEPVRTTQPQVSVKAEFAESAAASEPVKDVKISQLENKVQNMEAMLSKIYDTMSGGQKVTDEEVVETAPDKVSQFFYNNLVKNEVEASVADKILESVNEKLVSITSVNDTASVMFNIINGILGKPETIVLREDVKPTVVIFVGPTGVGKTTTLAKIAATFALHNKKKVGMITADTYRIAAVEQLKTYAEILGTPVSVIYSPSEIKGAIEQHSDKDLILIDTPGRSHTNKAQFDELKALVAASEADELYLVLSATTSNRNVQEILNNYSFLDNYKLIFTKLDETVINGVILNTRYFTGKSLSYVTNGQSVPDDIEVVNTGKITKSLLGSIQQ